MIDQFLRMREVTMNIILGFAEAFAIGGLDLEREERNKYKKE